MHFVLSLPILTTDKLRDHGLGALGVLLLRQGSIQQGVLRAKQNLRALLQITLQDWEQKQIVTFKRACHKKDILTHRFRGNENQWSFRVEVLFDLVFLANEPAIP